MTIVINEEKDGRYLPFLGWISVKDQPRVKGGLYASERYYSYVSSQRLGDIKKEVQHIRRWVLWAFVCRLFNLFDFAVKSFIVDHETELENKMQKIREFFRIKTSDKNRLPGRQESGEKKPAAPEETKMPPRTCPPIDPKASLRNSMYQKFRLRKLIVAS